MEAGGTVMRGGHRIALAPNNAQATYLARAAGTARFAYNWALAEWQRQYREHLEDESLPKPSQQALRRQLNAIKRDQFPWMLEVTKNAPQMVIVHLGDAFRVSTWVCRRWRRTEARDFMYDPDIGDGVEWEAIELALYGKGSLN